jgi:hypothetical protein
MWFSRRQVGGRAPAGWGSSHHLHAVQLLHDRRIPAHRWVLAVEHRQATLCGSCSGMLQGAVDRCARARDVAACNSTRGSLARAPWAAGPDGDTGAGMTALDTAQHAAAERERVLVLSDLATP